MVQSVSAATARPLPLDPFEGTAYRMIRQLAGRDGTHVYLVEHRDVGLQYTARLISEGGLRDAQHLARVRMQAAALGALDHAHLGSVQLVDATHDGWPFILTEYLQGRDLGSALASGHSEATPLGSETTPLGVSPARTLRQVLGERHKLSVSEALALGLRIAEHLVVSHAASATRRDLRPEKILLLDDDAVKLADFDNAEFSTVPGGESQADATQENHLYSSPEEIQGTCVTERSAIYALGSILYEVISGAPPCLMGLDEITPKKIGWSQISRVPPPLHMIVRNVPVYVGELVWRMLSKQASKRPASMEEVATLLRDARRRIEEEASRVSSASLEPCHYPHALDHRSRVEQEIVINFTRMRRPIATLLLSGLLVGAWFSWPKEEKRKPHTDVATEASIPEVPLATSDVSAASAGVHANTAAMTNIASAGDQAILQQIRDSTMANPMLAEKLAREHQARFPDSPYSDERDALLVAAVSNQHRAYDARNEAIHYFERHPNGAYADRIANALGMGPPPKQAGQPR